MKTDEYIQYLQENGVPDETIEKRIRIIEEFLRFKETGNNSPKEEAENFAGKLIVENRNTPENFTFLKEYFDWLDQREYFAAFIEIMDCCNALEVFASEMEKRHGMDIRDDIFDEPLPPLGASEKERAEYTGKILKRSGSLISKEQARIAWFQVQHGIPREYWEKMDDVEKEKFRKFNGIDSFLDKKRKERDEFLTHLKDTGKPWYTTEITGEVLEFIKGDPEMEVGKRDGNKIYISKVPYKANLYLNEKDERMKRYYACHCPLVRELILQDVEISQEICHCSLGHASHYLAGLDMKLKGEVLESAVKGDNRCRFVFYF